MRVLIVGCGYLGRRAADVWLEAGHSVSALTRSPRNAEELAACGIQPVIGDVTEPATLAPLPDADVLLFAVGFDRSAAPSKQEVYVDGLRNTLRAIEGRVGRVLYVSSTSVYGQSDGSWVDEDSASEPTSEGGRICLEAEGVVRCWSEESGTGALILRLAGIYGPGRLLAKLDAVHSGEPFGGRPDAWLNLIHVDDAARVAAAYSQTTHTGTVLVCDDQPVRRAEFYGALADLLSAPQPRFDDSRPGGRTEGLNKRCRNARMRRDLEGKLRFPSYREGLTGAISCVGRAQK